jgi:hypothetical protein
MQVYVFVLGKRGGITLPDPHPILKQAYGQTFGDDVAVYSPPRAFSSCLAGKGV